MYRHSRSSLWRWQAFTATPACREKPARLPGPPVSQSSSSKVGRVWSGEYLATPMRADGDAIGERVPHQIRHPQRHSGFASFRWRGKSQSLHCLRRVVFVQHIAKVELLGVALQQSFTLEQPPDSAGDDVGQLRQLGRRRFSHPLESRSVPVGRTHLVNPIQEQHVEVDVEVQRRAESRATAFQTRFFPWRENRPYSIACAGWVYRARAGRLLRVSGLPDQVAGNDPIDDAEHPANQRGVGGQKKSKWKGATQNPRATAPLPYCMRFAQDVRSLSPARATASLRGFLPSANRNHGLAYAAAWPTRAEPAALAAERQQMLGVAGVASQGQEPVLQPSALQVAIECLPHMGGQLLAGLSQVLDRCFFAASRLGAADPTQTGGLRSAGFVAQQNQAG